MRLAIVAPEHPHSRNRGGIARYLRDYLPALSERAAVTLVSVEDGPVPGGMPQHVPLACSLPSPVRPYCQSARVQRILVALAPDVVEYTNWLGLGCRDRGPWASVVRLSTPVMHGTLRPGLLPKLARPLHHRWEQRTVERADLWISNTAENLKTCRHVYGTAPPAVVIPHGLSLAETAPDPNAMDVLFVGRFERRKGVDVLFQAWERLAAEDALQSRRLHLVGRDTPGQKGGAVEEFLAALKTSPEALGIVMHGSLDDKALQTLRRQCAIAVIPSLYEPFGMVVLEAFAAGQAVVCSDAGGLREVVRDGETGRLFAASDAASLARVLHTVFRHPEEAAARVEAAREDLKSRFSPAQMAAASVKAFEQALALREYRGQVRERKDQAP